MSDHYTKPKFPKYADTKEPMITNCSQKYPCKPTKTTKSNNHLKTRDTTIVNTRKRNYNKYHINDYHITTVTEHGDISIGETNQETLYLNTFINTKIDEINKDDGWIIC